MRVDTVYTFQYLNSIQFLVIFQLIDRCNIDDKRIKVEKSELFLIAPSARICSRKERKSLFLNFYLVKKKSICVVNSQALPALPLVLIRRI